MAESIDAVQQLAISFAQELLASSTALVENSMGYFEDMIDIESFWATPKDAYVPDVNVPIAFEPFRITLPPISAARPDTPYLATINTIDVGVAPTFTVAEPVVTLPAAPNATLPSEPGNAPAFNAPSIPSAPAYSLPAAPVFAPIEIPPIPAADSVVFTEVLDPADIPTPTEVFSWNEQAYQSVMLDSLKAKLLADLLNGGYGIETADEQALWQRAVERELATADGAIEDAARQAAARGLLVPPGAMLAMISKAQQVAVENISTVQREIAMKRADMYVENRKFTIEQTREVENMLITYFGYMMERGLRAAQMTVELALAVYNAKLAKLNYNLERYKAVASVYEALIRGALLKIEQYKATVEGLRVSAEVQRVHADVYRTQIEGVSALIGIYKTRVEAAKTITEIEALKLQGYKTSVDAYTARIGAKEAEFGMYEARVKGELAKVQVYQTQVQAFAARTDAYKTQLSAKEVDLRAKLAVNGQKLDVYKADIGRYGAELEKSQIEMTSAIQKYEGEVRAYGITADAIVRTAQQKIEGSKANADVAVANAQVLSTNAIQAAQVLLSKSNTAGQTMAHIATAYGAAAASALNSATALTAEIV